jgi:hypothetical protein
MLSALSVISWARNGPNSARMDLLPTISMPSPVIGVPTILPLDVAESMRRDIAKANPNVLHFWIFAIMSTTRNLKAVW